jgi:hypothetical protein
MRKKMKRINGGEGGIRLPPFLASRGDCYT